MASYQLDHSLIDVLGLIHINRRLCRWRAALYLFLVPILATATEPHILVVYPEGKQSTSTIFSTIIEGINEVPGVLVSAHGVAKNFSTKNFQQWFSKREDVDVVIALGNRGLKAAKTLNTDVPIVVGGVLSLPSTDEMAGVSLTPDPEALFEQLRQLAPRIKRISVAYDPDRYQWLIERAEAAARTLSIKLTAMPASDRRSAARVYRALVNDSDTATDAIWLLQDSKTVDAKAVLPSILKEAWERSLLVFSSNPAHVPRGALFSLFADKLALGRSLSAVAVDIVAGDATPLAGLRPMTELKTAVNVRTATHLELRIPYELQRQFDMVFPKR